MAWAGTIAGLSIAYDGLVGYARRGGSEGTRIVPNLAVSLPADTAGGTRYTFRLRPGLRYSDGTLVRASDFRRAFERRFLSELPWPAPLVGVDACTRRPRSCDLTRGIRTDDEAGTMVFRLRRAQPASQFLAGLTVMWPIPRGTPDRDQGTRPIPSTGPYTVESYVPGRALTFVRNPHFRMWSPVARPDGYPDEIEVRLDGSAVGVAAIEHGLDVAFAPTGRPDEVRALADFRARHASQVRVGLGQHTVLLFLNTAHAPFDDVRVRQALNYAIDRGAVSEAYGGFEFALPTCQPSPPGTVGFRRYCPYTASPSRTGEWKAPDLPRARRLVAASGTRGMTVTVWTFETQPGRLLWENGVTGAVHALEQLGYPRASGEPGIWTIGRLEWAIGGHVGCRPESSAGTTSPGQRPPSSRPSDASAPTRPTTASSVTAGSTARIRQALEVQGTDPAAAVELWARIERAIVDLAPGSALHAWARNARLGAGWQRPAEP